MSKPSRTDLVNFFNQIDENKNGWMDCHELQKVSSSRLRSLRPLAPFAPPLRPPPLADLGLLPRSLDTDERVAILVAFH